MANTLPIGRIAAWFVALGACTAVGVFHLLQDRKIERVYEPVLNTGLVNFDTVWASGFDASQEGLGGGLGLHPQGIFAAQKAELGKIFFLPVGSDALQSIGARLPQNNRSKIPVTTPQGQEIERGLLRYNDLAVRRANGTDRLLVSYSYFKTRGNCFVGRVAEAVLPEGWLDRLRNDDEAGLSEWRVVHETSPCLPIVEGAGHAFTGHQAGGRIAVEETGDVLLTVGDYAFDGLEGKLPPHPQIPDSSYGKVVRLTPSPNAQWASDVVAMGLRNPQGIDVDEHGNIWEVEHAAMGGDELNLIEQGENYGWPEVTLGVDYVDEASDAKDWPFNPRTGFHEGYDRPTYAWMPSVAPSSVKVVRELTPRWDGDLLVGALRGRSLYRIRLAGERVVMVETIPLSRRVRHLEIGHGRLYVLSDFGELAIFTPRVMASEHVDIGPLLDAAYDPGAPHAAAPVGARSPLSANGCVECHSGPPLPRLSGLLGTPIAAQDGVDYSAALAAKGGRWDEENLRAFLTDPQAFAPGTTMPARGLSPKALQAVIDALRERGSQSRP